MSSGTRREGFSEEVTNAKILQTTLTSYVKAANRRVAR